MPLTKEHKQQTRARIVESARILFNRHGFNAVSIDMIMADAKLTRGGFYNHFRSKEALFSEAIRGFLAGRGAVWREEAGIDLQNLRPEMARQMMESYLSCEHLDDLEGQCPMIALPSDVARSGPEAQDSFQELLSAMVWLFERSLDDTDPNSREHALSLSALCVGAMVLSRTLPNSELSDEVRHASRQLANEIIGSAKV